MSCHAFADQMTLARYYYHESEYHLKSIGKLTHLNKFTGDIVWGPLDELEKRIRETPQVCYLHTGRVNDFDNSGVGAVGIVYWRYPGIINKLLKKKKN